MAYTFKETVSEHIVAPALAKAANSADLDNATYEILGVIIAYDPVENKFGFRPNRNNISMIAPKVLDGMFPMKKKKHEIGDMNPQIGDQVTLVVRGRMGVRGAYLAAAYSSEGNEAFDCEAVGYESLCPGKF